MSQTIKNDKKILIFSVAVAAITVIAGILHLQMVPRSLSENLGEGTLFLVGGLAQIFWAIPVIKRWGKVWQIIGIIGTVIFFVLWYASRLHLISEGGLQSHPAREFSRGNTTGGDFPRGVPSRGPGIQIGGITLPPIEMLQIAFIGLYSTLSIMISKKKTDSKQV